MSTPKGLYAVGGSHASIYKMDNVTGSLSVLAQTTSAIVGLAFSGNTLCGITSSEFVTINPGTGKLEVVGQLSISGAQSMAASSAGQIYCIATPASQGTSLYTIDTQSGKATLVGNLVPGPAAVAPGCGGLAFDSNDRLYVTATAYNPGSLKTVCTLQTIDTGNGAMSLQNVAIAGASTLPGLAFYGDNLYAISSTGALYAVNTFSGLATQIGSSNIAGVTLQNLCALH